jgi:hypothetical protein
MHATASTSDQPTVRMPKVSIRGMRHLVSCSSSIEFVSTNDFNVGAHDMDLENCTEVCTTQHQSFHVSGRSGTVI